MSTLVGHGCEAVGPVFADYKRLALCYSVCGGSAWAVDFKVADDVRANFPASGPILYPNSVILHGIQLKCSMCHYGIIS